MLNNLESRIIEISKKHGLSHNGSCLTAVNIIDEIYSIKKEDEIFILSSGHAFLALAVVLEKYYGRETIHNPYVADTFTILDKINFNAEVLYLKHGTHPNRDIEDKIYCSTGSLGWGISIACGMAIADRTKNVYCLISDGESFEGVVYEVSNVIKKYDIENLKLYINFNGWGAYDIIEKMHLEVIKTMFPQMIIFQTKVSDYGFKGQESHYVKL